MYKSIRVSWQNLHLGTIPSKIPGHFFFTAVLWLVRRDTDCLRTCPSCICANKGADDHELFLAKQLNIKFERSIWWNHAPSTTLSIPKLWWYDELSLASLLQEHHESL